MNMRTLFYNTRFLILFLIIYPLLFIWQGIDLTDQGYVLTNYQRVFDDPPTSLDQLTLFLWLSMVIGGLWYNVFGFLGVIGFKLAYAITLYITLVFAYQTLKPHFDKKQLLFALLVTQMFIIKADVKWIYYNTLTSLFYVTAGFFLIKGLKKQSNLLIFVAALLLGINTFIRIPNGLGLSLILVILFYGYVNSFSRDQYMRLSLSFLCGYLGGLGITFMMMASLGHLEIFLEALINIPYRLSSESDVHSAKRLTVLLIKDPVLMVILSLSFIGSIAFLSIFLSKLKYKALQYASILIVTGFAYYIFTIQESWKWIYTGSICFMLLYHIVKKDQQASELRSICFLSLILLFLTAFGSDNGIRNSCFGMWLGMPISILFLLQIKPVALLKGIITPASISFAQKLVFSIIIISTLIIAFRYTYRDSPNRFSLYQSINHPMLKGVLTTKARSETLQELLAELSKYVNEGDDLFAYEQTQLIYYLTNTKPYLYHSSPMLYQPKEFEAMLVKARKKKKKLPIVVRAKSNTKRLNWPEGPDAGVEMDDRIIGCRRVAQTFLDEHRYKLLWENTFFEIWSPRINRKM